MNFETDHEYLERGLEIGGRLNETTAIITKLIQWTGQFFSMPISSNTGDFSKTNFVHLASPTFKQAHACLERIEKELRELVPPKPNRTLHEAYVAAVHEYVKGSLLYLRALDSASFERAMRLFNEGTTIVNSAACLVPTPTISGSNN